MMPQKNEEQADRYPEHSKKSSKGYFSRIKSWTQTWIITLAVWGWLPYWLAEWILRRGGRHGK